MTFNWGNFLGILSSIIGIGAGTYWVHDVNSRISLLEAKANVGIGAAAVSGVSAGGTPPINQISLGQDTLEMLCSDVGKKLAATLSDKDYSVSVKVNLESYFSSLNCAKILASGTK